MSAPVPAGKLIYAKENAAAYTKRASPLSQSLLANFQTDDELPELNALADFCGFCRK